jgi:hypothetical protein
VTSVAKIDSVIPGLASTLHLGRSGYHQDSVATGVPASFEQQWDVQHGEGAPFPLGLGEEGLFRPANERVHNLFQTPELAGLAGLAEHYGAELGPIDHTIARGSGKGGLDQRRRLTTIERVNRQIGIMDGNAAGTKHGCGRRLAHADGSGQAENEGHKLSRASRRLR